MLRFFSHIYKLTDDLNLKDEIDAYLYSLKSDKLLWFSVNKIDDFRKISVENINLLKQFGSLENLYRNLNQIENEKIRKNRHSLFMFPMKKYVDTAEQTGFKLRNTIDMSIANHPFNYLFCFEKVYG